MSRFSSATARWMAGSAFVRSISRPLSGNLAGVRTWSGTRTTRCSSRGSTLTNAFITLSRANSCERATSREKKRQPRMTMKTNRRVLWVTALQLRRRWPGHIPPRPSARFQVLVLPSSLVSTLTVVSFNGHEFLNATTADRFAQEHVALRIEHNRVQEGELACVMPGSAESREDRPGGTVEGPKNLVSTIDVEHEGLLSILRERDVPRRSSGILPPPRHDVDDSQRLAHAIGRLPCTVGWVFLEHLDAIAAAIAGVNQPCVAEHYAVGMSAVIRLELARPKAGVPPLPQEHAVPVEYHHAVVAVAICDIDVAVGGIHRHVRRLFKPGPTRVRAWIAAGPVGRVAETSGPDLEQHRPAVVRVLLHDSISIAGDPDVVLVVDETAMQTIRHDVSVAKGVHHVSFAVELDDRRGGDCDHILGSDQVPAVYREDMIVRIDASSSHFPGDPRFARGLIMGQRSGPGRIDPITGRSFVICRCHIRKHAPEVHRADRRQDATIFCDPHCTLLVSLLRLPPKIAIFISVCAFKRKLSIRMSTLSRISDFADRAESPGQRRVSAQSHFDRLKIKKYCRSRNFGSRISRKPACSASLTVRSRDIRPSSQCSGGGVVRDAGSDSITAIRPLPFSARRTLR